MVLRELLYLLLMGLPAHRLDHEEPEARQIRLRVIAEAVSAASLRATCSGVYTSPTCEPLTSLSTTELGVLLITQAYSESRLARNVHEGKCHSYECDPIRNPYTGEVRHRARSLWQIHRIGPIEFEWDRMQGSDQESTNFAAWAAAKLLSRGYRACRSIIGTIAQYAGLGGCEWSGATGRARLFSMLLRRAARIESRLSRNQ